MNILHMKYAYEVARAGSLSKASEALLIAVPNISRSIKELEADLGIAIFDRTTKGMCLTPEGEEFMNYAKTILGQIEQVEKQLTFQDCLLTGSSVKRNASLFCTDITMSLILFQINSSKILSHCSFQNMLWNHKEWHMVFIISCI